MEQQPPFLFILNVGRFCMAETDEKREFRMMFYGVLCSTLVFLIYEVGISLSEHDVIKADVKLIVFIIAIFVTLPFAKALQKIHSMKMEHVLIISVVVAVGATLAYVVFIADTPKPITITTDWSSYVGSAIIRASGEVNPIVPNEKVSIIILYQDGEVYNMTSVSLVGNTYEYKFSIKPIGYGVKNVFKIGAMYAGNSTFASFEYEDNRFPSSSLSP